MVDGDSVKRVIAGGSYVERLVCHARLPLIAGLDSARPAVHVWEFGATGLRELGVVAAGPDAYPPEPWERHRMVPELAWHPYDPGLVVAGAGLRRWTPDGVSAVTGAPAEAGYRAVAYSPDGRTLWAWPASLPDEDEAWQRSDALDLATGTVRCGPAWDTGVVEHPGGGLVATLSSDQGATDVLFARPDGDVPASLRLLRDAIILDVDCYEAPVFSRDGRYLALRGNAYVHSLDVFEFPSMRRVLHTTLGEAYPGYPYPPEWLAEQSLWSRHNIAFAPGSGTLLVGTSGGTVISLDLEREQAAEHDVAPAPISALAVMPTGQLVVADRSGQIAVMSAPGDTDREVGAAAARTRVEEFLAATTELPDDADLETALIRHDGQRVWSADDLDTVTAAEDTDPTWLRLQAAINTVRQQR
ncbi:hypothetical protein [Dactylosporangium salmoneum]|uniref:WD40 repeat domain-containing protein n=1 Tax=Dactylosporangium salmoneum TaxID=53361 RepID=A0ABP5UCK8_9ACTN